MKRIEDELFTLITAQLRDGNLLPPAMFRDQFFRSILRQRTYGGYAGARFSSKTFLRENPPSISSETVLLVEQLANIKVRKATQSCIFSDEDERDELCKEMAEDFALIIQALYASCDLPFVNGVWIAHRAGQIPTRALEVPGAITDLVRLEPNEALVRFQEASGRLDQGEARAEEERTRVDLAIAGAYRDHILSGDLFLDAFREFLFVGGLLGPETRIATNLQELGDAPGPESWRRALEHQGSGHKIDWGAIWGTALDTFPSVRNFLEEKCHSVSILHDGGGSPYLLYHIFIESPYRRAGIDCSFILGGLPQAHPDTFHRYLRMMPPALRDFYSVHDGWATSGDYIGGPKPLAIMSSIQEWFPDVPETRVGNRVVKLVDIIEIMKPHNERMICLDASSPGEQGKPAIVFSPHREERITLGGDVVAEINAEINDSAAAMLPATRPQ